MQPSDANATAPNAPKVVPPSADNPPPPVYPWSAPQEMLQPIVWTHNGEERRQAYRNKARRLHESVRTHESVTHAIDSSLQYLHEERQKFALTAAMYRRELVRHESGAREERKGQEREDFYTHVREELNEGETMAIHRFLDEYPHFARADDKLDMQNAVMQWRLVRKLRADADKKHFMLMESQRPAPNVSEKVHVMYRTLCRTSAELAGERASQLEAMLAQGKPSRSA